MQTQRIQRAGFFENRALPAAASKKVLAVSFDPAHLRAAREKISVVLDPQPDPATLGASVHASGCAGFKAPPTMCSQVPLGTLNHSSGSASVLASPEQTCPGPAQSLLPAFATP